jgi:hypothetical protein
MCALQVEEDLGVLKKGTKCGEETRAAYARGLELVQEQPDAILVTLVEPWGRMARLLASDGRSPGLCCAKDCVSPLGLLVG